MPVVVDDRRMVLSVQELGSSCCADKLRWRILGPCTQVQGLGPCPQGTAPMIRCLAVWRHGESRRHNRTSEPPPPHHHHHHPQGSDRLTRCVDFRCPVVDRHASAWRTAATGASKRRRERRLRQWQRHERMTVAMAVAEATHHSAPRRQKTATVIREGEVQEKYDALRRQNTLHPGERPGSLFDPGPQRSDRSLRRSSGETPLLFVPSLADPLAEASDGRTLRFLFTKALALKKEDGKDEFPLVAIAIRCTASLRTIDNHLGFRGVIPRSPSHALKALSMT